jgi:outer membrane protein TolC
MLPGSRTVRAAAMIACFAAATSASAQSGGTALVPLTGRSAQGGTVVATQTPVPGATASVDTLNPLIQVVGGYAGSALPKDGTAAGPLTLREALRRGVEYNLGPLNLAEVVAAARGQRTVARSALLPNIVSDLTAIRQEVNLSSFGLHFTSPIPGFDFPTVVGPFNQVDLRAHLSQTVLNMTALNNYRASTATLRANEMSVKDANDLVVLAVGGAYLQAIAARSRVAAGRAQLETANALFQQSAQRRAVGLIAQVDVGRSQVQALTQQQRLTSLQNDFAKQKINLARMVGLPPTDRYELGDDVPYSPAPTTSLDDALKQAQELRADLKAAAAQVEAAEKARAAAGAERLPSVAVNADYGTIGPTFPEAHKTFSVVGRVTVPIWRGGSTEGVIQQADAAIRQRRAEFDDLRSQVEGEVRKAFLDLEAAQSQVEVAVQNQDVARQTLDLTRQRFDAGITDSVEVVQAQEAAAQASLDYINSVFAHNLAKLAVARATGVAAERVNDFLKLP